MVFLSCLFTQASPAWAFVSVGGIVGIRVCSETPSRARGPCTGVSESTDTWVGSLVDLVRRGPRAPSLIVSDGAVVVSDQPRWPTGPTMTDTTKAELTREGRPRCLTRWTPLHRLAIG